MQHHEWISKYEAERKKSDAKIYSIGTHLYEALQQTNLGHLGGSGGEAPAFG